MNHKLRGRRRHFATPFVLTAAIAPACVSQAPAGPQPSPQPDGTAQTGTTTPQQVDQNGNPIGTTVNPPPPGTDVTPKPPVIVNPPAPAPLPDPPADGKGKLVSKADGTCWYFAAVECKPNVTCNPPPPMQVNCKADPK